MELGRSNPRLSSLTFKPLARFTGWIRLYQAVTSFQATGADLKLPANETSSGKTDVEEGQSTVITLNLKKGFTQQEARISLAASLRPRG